MAKRSKIVLCDTGPFIYAIRNNPHVLNEFDSIGFENLYISSISVGEIFQGMNSREKSKTLALLSNFNRIYLSIEISIKFEQLMLGYKKSGLQVGDGLIAAVALIHRAELFTFNRKDFDYIKGIKLYNPTQSLP